jgi:collagen type VII alpha
VAATPPARPARSTGAAPPRTGMPVQPPKVETAMAPREILFVDPAVSDPATLLGGLRPGVAAIMLDAARPPARQIAEALAGRSGLAAVHVVAHGEPGRVRFAAGDGVRATPDRDDEQMTSYPAIGG